MILNFLTNERTFSPEDETGGVAAVTPAPEPAPNSEGDLISGGDEGSAPLETEGGAGQTAEDDLISGGDGEIEGTVPSETIDRDALTSALPEGFEVTDQEQFSAFLDTIESAGTRQEIAEKVLGMFAEHQANLAQEQADQWAGLQNTWKEETRADPEIGGKALAENLATAKAIAQEYGGEDFLNLLKVSGAGNNVAMTKFLLSVAKAIPGEAAPVTGHPSGDAAKSLADRMFSNS